MKTLRISDLQTNGVLAIDLRHVLRLLGQRSLGCTWQVSSETTFDEPLFATGNKAAELEALSTSEGRIDGTAMHDLAENVTQVIWGEFRAYDDVASEPWVIVRAVDSTYYEVTSSDPSVLEIVRRAFHDVKEL